MLKENLKDRYASQLEINRLQDNKARRDNNLQAAVVRPQTTSTAEQSFRTDRQSEITSVLHVIK
jgi:hypothetical protein